MLFVCTANRCRSPLAAAILLRKLQQEGLDGKVRVESAGTWARQGVTSPEPARQAAREAGLDLDRHLSRPVQADLLDPFPAILVMEAGHREGLQTEFPAVSERIHLLSGTAGAEYDIADPAEADAAGYRRLVRELEDVIDRGFARILDLAGGQPA